jgi:hypothetical protein
MKDLNIEIDQTKKTIAMIVQALGAVERDLPSYYMPWVANIPGDIIYCGTYQEAKEEIEYFLKNSPPDAVQPTVAYDTTGNLSPSDQECYRALCQLANAFSFSLDGVSRIELLRCIIDRVDYRSDWESYPHDLRPYEMRIRFRTGVQLITNPRSAHWMWRFSDAEPVREAPDLEMLAFLGLVEAHFTGAQEDD